MQVILAADLLMILTLRLQRYEPQKPLRFTRARLVTTI
jgi:hypothetical protein